MLCLKCTIFCVSLGLQHSGLGRRKTPKDSSEGPGWCCEVIKLSDKLQSINSFSFISSLLNIITYLSVFPHCPLSILQSPSAQALLVSLTGPVRSATLWSCCPEKTQSWWMQNTQRTRPGSLRGSVFLRSHQTRVKLC